MAVLKFPSRKTVELEFFLPDFGGGMEIPNFLSKVSAGLPFPVDDHDESRLDLNNYLVRHPSQTFYVRVTGDSMTGAGIHSGDMLIVDRAIKARDGSIVLAVVEGGFTVKKLRHEGNRMFLQPENPDFKPIEITQEMDFEIWGVVTNVIHRMA